VDPRKATSIERRSPTGSFMTLFSRDFFKDLISSYAAEIFVILASVCVPTIVTRLASIEVLGLYLLLRRVAIALANPLSLGLSAATSRELPLLDQDESLQARWSLFAALTSGGFSLLCLGVVFLRPAAIAKLVFGDAQLAGYIWPMALLTLATVLQSVVFGVYRGMFKIHWGNLLMGLTAGVVPIACLFDLRRIGLAASIELMGAANLILSLFFLLPLAWTCLRTAFNSPPWIRKASRSLLGYGIARVPDGALNGFFFALGTVQLAHKASLADVAIFALGMNFLRLGQTVIAPIGVVIFPRLSMSIYGESHHRVMKDLNLMLATLTPLALFGAAQAAILHQTILFLWLGRAAPSAGLLFVPLLLTLPFYITFEVLKYALDAASVFPYNIIAMGGAVAVLAIVGSFHFVAATVVAQFAAFVLLGTVTLFVWRRLYHIRRMDFGYFIQAFLFVAASIPWTFLLYRYVSHNLLVLTFNELALAALLLMIVVRCGARFYRSVVVPASPAA
jgi:O-antigen/teichoic acid export membrane protein